MKSRAEYFREYRAKKGDATIHAKVDLLIEMVEQLLGGKKLVIPVPVPKPVVKLEPMHPAITPLKSVAPTQSSKVTCKCGGPAFYEDAQGHYCATHATRDAEPI